jgi:hypothetical protein
MRYIGIDPGKSGGLASVPDLLTIRTPVDSEREYDIQAMRRALVRLIGDGPAFVVIERAQAMRKPTGPPCQLCNKPPTQGLSSTFGYGVGYGIWIGLLVGLGFSHRDDTSGDPLRRFIDVPPQSWTKMMIKNAPFEGKDRSIWVAKKRIPEWKPRTRGEELALCDAILLAEYGRIITTHAVFSKPGELELEYA